MNPLLQTFLKITAIVAIAIAGLFLLAWVLKIVVVAAIVAAIAVGGIFLYNLVRRRNGVPMGR